MARIGTTSSVVAVLWVVLAVGVGVEKCMGWEETVDGVKGKINQMSDDANIPEKAEAVKEGAAGVLHDAKDTAESWSSWVYNKFSGGSKPEEEAVPKETAHFAVDGGLDAPTTGASLGEAAKMATETAGKAIETGKEKAGDVAAAAADKAGDMKKMAKDAIHSGQAKAADLGAKIKEKSSEL